MSANAIRSVILLLSCAAILAPVAAQVRSCPIRNGTTSSGGFPLLQQMGFANELEPISKPSWNTWLGGQNIKYCCVVALEEWIENGCTDTDSVRVDREFFNLTSQFPCDAAYLGTLPGAPVVWASRGWSESNCSGWQLSVFSRPTQWLQMLVCFLLPSVAFSLNVPRRRRLRTPSHSSHKSVNKYRRILSISLSAPASMAVIALKVICWQCTIFTAAGPLLLSCLYEIWLDTCILSFLERKANSSRLPTVLRARILLTMLRGNLDLSPAWKETMKIVSSLDELEDAFSSQVSSSEIIKGWAQTSVRAEARCETRQGQCHGLQHMQNQAHEMTPRQANATCDSVCHTEIIVPRDNIQQYMYPALDAIDASSKSRAHRAGFSTVTIHPFDSLSSERALPQSLPTLSNHQENKPNPGPEDNLPSDGSACSSFPRSTWERSMPPATGSRNCSSDPAVVLQFLPERLDTVHVVAERLERMLASRHSFGTTIGGPILFYSCAFIYALGETKQKYGNNNIAYALAFACWWMIIPYVAIVTNSLIGGHSSDVRRGTACDDQPDFIIGGNTPSQILVDTPGRIHNAVHRPASVWDRGQSKQKWLLVLAVDSLSRYKVGAGSFTRVREPVIRLLDGTVLWNSIQWLCLLSLALTIVLVPCLLTLLVTYCTPQVGIGCRSLTVLLYASAQALLMILWVVRITWRDEYWRQGLHLRRGLPNSQDQAACLKFWNRVQQLVHMALWDTEAPERMTHNWGQSIRRLVLVLCAMPARKPHGRYGWPTTVECTHHILCVLGFTVAMLSGIGGTLLQMIGPYRSCYPCKFNVRYWGTSARDGPLIFLSSNSTEEIRQASKVWLFAGGASVGSLAILCFVAWWYQERLKRRFIAIVNEIGQAAVDT